MDGVKMTNEDALARWDSGSPIFTCAMGGMGPGYEQAIHIIAMELFRSMIAEPFDWPVGDDWTGDAKERMKIYLAKIEATKNVKNAIRGIQPSGAQFGAAMNVATLFSRKGYEAAKASIPEDRLIQISSHFPALQRDSAVKS